VHEFVLGLATPLGLMSKKLLKSFAANNPEIFTSEPKNSFSQAKSG